MKGTQSRRQLPTSLLNTPKNKTESQGEITREGQHQRRLTTHEESNTISKNQWIRRKRQEKQKYDQVDVERIRKMDGRHE